MIYLVQHFLENSAQRLPNKVALVSGSKRLTYREINERADRLAAALIDMGIQRQDRVTIFLDNSVESVIALYAILKAGAIFIMLSATMKAKKLNYILKDSDTRVLITHPNKARIVKEAITGISNLESIVWAGKSSNLVYRELNVGNCSWDEILSDHSAFRIPHSTLNLEPHAPCPMSYANRCIDLDLATIIYTSGSTGEPKGVMSAHYNVISAAKSIIAYLENVEDDIILCALPLSFDYGLYQVLMAFMFGGTVVLEKSFVFPYKILERLVQERVTAFPIVPTMAALLLQIDDLSKFDLTCLRYISNTAAALPVAHIHKLQKKFSGSKIFSMYGLTECKRVSYLPPDELVHRPGSVGIPIPNEEVFIFDEDGSEVGCNEIGELVMRGSNVMQGYWKDAESTARVFRTDPHSGERMLFSGDLFRKDEDGFLYFVARKDDLIKTKGERVSPKEIENVLCEIDGIIEAAVIGVPDEIFGQAIKAFVRIDDKMDLDKNAVLSHCKQSLEPFMVPKYIEFRDNFPRSATGKINKKELENQLPPAE